MTEAAVAANVHQSLDVHGGFTAKVTLDREQIDLVANFFEFNVVQIFDLFVVSNATRFANFASAGTANAENSRQADFCVLVRWNVDTCNTCHVGPLNFNQP